MVPGHQSILRRFGQGPIRLYETRRGSVMGRSREHGPIGADHERMVTLLRRLAWYELRFGLVCIVILVIIVYDRGSQMITAALWGGAAGLAFTVFRPAEPVKMAIVRGIWSRR